MPYSDNDGLPDAVKNSLSGSEQTKWREVFNGAYDGTCKGDEACAAKVAWAAVKKNNAWAGEELNFEKLSRKPDSIENEDGRLRIRGVMLAPGEWNGLDYKPEHIALAHIPDASTGQFKLTVDHGQGFFDSVGIFTQMEKGKDNLSYNAIIDDPKTIEFVNRRRETLKKAGLPDTNAFDISSELFAKRVMNKESQKLEAQNIRILRASLVLEGACPSPHCTVETVQNDKKDCGCPKEELATKCEAKYMDEDRKRYQKGFDGCVEAKMACAGLDKKHATKMCNYIFWRRGGASNSLEEDNKIVLSGYFAAEDKEAYVNRLGAEMPKELLSELSSFNEDIAQLNAFWLKHYTEELNVPGEEKKCEHLAIIEAKDAEIVKLVADVTALKSHVVAILTKNEYKTEELAKFDVAQLIVLAEHVPTPEEKKKEGEESDEEKKKKKAAEEEEEMRKKKEMAKKNTAIRGTQVGEETPPEKLATGIPVDIIKA